MQYFRFPTLVNLEKVPIGKASIVFKSVLQVSVIGLPKLTQNCCSTNKIGHTCV